jgi:hypothetical protein
VRLSPQQILDCVRIATKYDEDFSGSLGTLIRGIVRLAISREGLEPLDLNTEGAVELLKGFGVSLERGNKRRSRELFTMAQEDSVKDLPAPFIDPAKVKEAREFLSKFIPPPEEV